MPKEKLLIGRNEDIDLPDLKLRGLDAKIDTGAYTSSMHCHHIETCFEGADEILKFRLLDPEHPRYQSKTFKFRNFKYRKVKSSNGVIEKRFVIKTNLKIYNKVFETEFTLTDRSDMKSPVLLGRKFIKQGFIVDVNKRDFASKNLKCKLIITKEKK